MPKYQHEKTRDIISASLFMGDMKKLESEMPLLNDNALKSIRLQKECYVNYYITYSNKHYANFSMLERGFFEANYIKYHKQDL